MSKLPRQSNYASQYYNSERDKIRTTTKVTSYRDRQATRYIFIYSVDFYIYVSVMLTRHIGGIAGAPLLKLETLLNLIFVYIKLKCSVL